MKVVVILKLPKSIKVAAIEDFDSFWLAPDPAGMVGNLFGLSPLFRNVIDALAFALDVEAATAVQFDDLKVMELRGNQLIDHTAADDMSEVFDWFER